MSNTVTVHFIYSVFADGFRNKLRRRAMSMMQNAGFNRTWVSPRSDIDTRFWPYHAPVSITKNVYEALREQFDTRLYDFRERTIIHGGPEDILIGHPCPGQDRSVWNASCMHGEFAARIGMWPLHHGLPHINAALDHLVPQMDRILAITGPYWFDTWENSIFADWKPKMVRLDMAIDTRYYPRIKKHFNPRGQRKFLYIGNGGPCKGVHLLSMLFERAKQLRCVWIGGESGRFRNLEARPGGTLTPDFMQPLAKECDFFITLGVSDANPTTILEAMAWGFPVCCTPQSGYYRMPETIEMSTTDMKYNLEVLDWLQGASEDWLCQQADKARHLVRQHYTWQRFTQSVITELTRVMAAKHLSGGIHALTKPTAQEKRQ